jgi:Tfp pilus assembly protein PilP
MRVNVTLIAVIISALFAFYGCGSPPPPKPKAKPKKKVETVAVVKEKTSLEGTKFEKGYVYEQRNRRDPFISLIIPTEIKGVEAVKVGTLEGYDISQFVLAAIAKRGPEYYALLTTPDDRSFTVTKGNIIGFNRGRVEEITADKIVFVEYSKDYKGDMKPKHIILEFVKGEVR